MEKTEKYIVEARDDIKVPKPPLGAKPYSIVGPARIHELTEAILRYIDDPQLNRDKLAVMKTWARETVEQLDLLDTMLIYE